MYPYSVTPESSNIGVDIQIISANRSGENQNIVSTLSVNISALKEAGVSTVSCGFFSTSSRSYINVTFNSDRGKSFLSCITINDEEDVFLLVPRTPTDLSAQLKYNTKSQLTEIEVQWKEIVS